MERILKIILAILLFACLFDFPYGYYEFVRFLSFVLFGYFAFDEYKKGNQSKALIYVALAILFQPLQKISLGRTLWNIVDVLVAIWLIVEVKISENEGNRDKKEMNYKLMIKSYFYALLLSFIGILIFEHFGEFSYIANPKNEVYQNESTNNNADWGAKYTPINDPFRTYNIDSKTPILTIHYKTLFGNKLKSDGSKFTVGDFMYSDSKFNYFEKFIFYIKATFYDFLYVIFLSLIFGFLLYHFKNEKSKEKTNSNLTKVELQESENNIINSKFDSRIDNKIKPKRPISATKIFGYLIIIITSLFIVIPGIITGLVYLFQNGFSDLKIGDYFVSFLMIGFFLPILLLGGYLIKLSNTSKIISEEERLLQRKKTKKSIKVTLIVFFSIILVACSFSGYHIFKNWDNLEITESLRSNSQQSQFPIDSASLPIDSTSAIINKNSTPIDLQDSIVATPKNETTINQNNTDYNATKYSFIIIKTEDQYTGEKGGIITGIFETSQFISEDEKYKLLDEAQTNAQFKLIGKNITKRELKSYDSYAEASKARENL